MLNRAGSDEVALVFCTLYFFLKIRVEVNVFRFYLYCFMLLILPSPFRARWLFCHDVTLTVSVVAPVRMCGCVRACSFLLRGHFFVSLCWNRGHALILFLCTKAHRLKGRRQNTFDQRNCTYFVPILACSRLSRNFSDLASSALNIRTVTCNPTYWLFMHRCLLRSSWF